LFGEEEDSPQRRKGRKGILFGTVAESFYLETLEKHERVRRREPCVDTKNDNQWLQESHAKTGVLHYAIQWFEPFATFAPLR
jgi:hypothetical protein